jgi:hypothetical protein
VSQPLLSQGSVSTGRVVGRLADKWVRLYVVDHVVPARRRPAVRKLLIDLYLYSSLFPEAKRIDVKALRAYYKAFALRR